MEYLISSTDNVVDAMVEAINKCVDIMTFRWEMRTSWTQSQLERLMIQFIFLNNLLIHDLVEAYIEANKQISIGKYLNPFEISKLVQYSMSTYNFRIAWLQQVATNPYTSNDNGPDHRHICSDEALSMH